MTTRHYTPAYRTEDGTLVTGFDRFTTSYEVAKQRVAFYNETNAVPDSNFVFVAFRDVPDWAEHTAVTSADLQDEGKDIGFDDAWRLGGT